MSPNPRRFAAQVCHLMSLAIALGFLIFAAYSCRIGISKQAVYAGSVGYWLGVYLLSSGVMSFACVILILWMAATKQRNWRTSVTTFALAWFFTLVAYVAWHLFAKSQYTGSV